MKASSLNTFLVVIISIFILSCKDLDDSTSIETFPEVEALISQMSIEEKVGQTAQITLDALTKGEDVFTIYEPVTLDPALLKEAIVDYHLGSVLNTANNRAMSTEKWASLIASIQDMAAQSKYRIPVLYGVDAIHGATYTAGSTLGPQQIAVAATWNKQLAYDLAATTAYETRASCIPWTFSPVLDLGMDPRWSRQWETFGEDTYLGSVMGMQTVKGYQGDDLSSPIHVAACLKHFLAYSAARSGKDRTPGELSNVALREYHLPAFKAAIDAGAASIMINSGIINGTPVHANYNLITTLLKDELGFEGLVVTDWADIENLYNRDKVVRSHKEAIKISFNAGIDMSMVPYDYKRYCDLLIELVKEGDVSMARLDDAVRRILNLKHKLGLFDQSKHCLSDYPKFGSSSFEKGAYNATAEAITLLKNNNNILPLKKGTRLLVTGPNANSMRTLNGGWSYSWQGEKTEEFASQYNTILEAIQKEFGKNKVSYVSGVEYNMKGAYHDDNRINIEKVISEAKKSDVVILCLGENTYTEKPGDLHDLMISENQQALARALAKTNTPIVLVLNEGRPRIIRNIEPHTQAVVQTYLSGNYAGDALADILSGDVNPSGKLPYTYPRYSNSLVVYNHKPSEESTTPEGMYDYSGGFFPQYEFGFGLSYTTFTYSDLKVSHATLKHNQKLKISVNVKNIGRTIGKEVVQLYSYDHYASITPDVKRLRRFDKIELAPGESKEVSFTIGAKDLSFINAAGERVTENGKFTLTINTLKTEISFIK
ncbi:MAG: glycoside hydrolase family 3 C-terminal domain-containing protein [Bacteroidales bacterium]|jgi:beta-glucosidase|nr:glycoside hydrolase family 3 C-terminal domain-containing protein [Bacteroidales bacterium]